MNGRPLNREPRGFAKERRVVHFAVTTEQYEELSDMAMLKNMNVSEFIRAAIFSKAQSE